MPTEKKKHSSRGGAGATLREESAPSFKTASSDPAASQPLGGGETAWSWCFPERPRRQGGPLPMFGQRPSDLGQCRGWPTSADFWRGVPMLDQSWPKLGRRQPMPNVANVGPKLTEDGHHHHRPMSVDAFRLPAQVWPESEDTEADTRLPEQRLLPHMLQDGLVPTPFLARAVSSGKSASASGLRLRQTRAKSCRNRPNLAEIEIPWPGRPASSASSHRAGGTDVRPYPRVVIRFRPNFGRAPATTGPCPPRSTPTRTFPKLASPRDGLRRLDTATSSTSPRPPTSANVSRRVWLSLAQFGQKPARFRQVDRNWPELGFGGNMAANSGPATRAKTQLRDHDVGLTPRNSGDARQDALKRGGGAIGAVEIGPSSADFGQRSKSVQARQTLCACACCCADQCFE